jgi:DNA-binding GntR family transcriptional regulator
MPRSRQDLLPPTRAKAAATRLREEIQDGTVTPGTRLRQVDVAERFGVSTTPVREAFVTLAREGLVSQDAHRGVIVFAPSVEELAEIYEVRVILEPAATRLAATRMTPETLEELDGIIARMVKAKPSEYAELNTALHNTIYRAADRPLLMATIENLRERAGSYLLIAVNKYSDSYFERVQEEHEEIVALLREGTPARAARAVRGHLESSTRQVTGLISGGPSIS